MLWNMSSGDEENRLRAFLFILFGPCGLSESFWNVILLTSNLSIRSSLRDRGCQQWKVSLKNLQAWSEVISTCDSGMWPHIFFLTEVAGKYVVPSSWVVVVDMGTYWQHTFIKFTLKLWDRQRNYCPSMSGVGTSDRNRGELCKINGGAKSERRKEPEEQEVGKVYRMHLYKCWLHWISRCEVQQIKCQNESKSDWNIIRTITRPSVNRYACSYLLFIAYDLHHSIQRPALDVSSFMQKFHWNTLPWAREILRQTRMNSAQILPLEVSSTIRARWARLARRLCSEH